MQKITEENIKKYLGNLPYNFEIFDVIDSTSTYARENPSHNKVIISDMQLNGRGRMGRTFHSPSDNGIYMSVVLKVDKSYQELELFTIAIASLTHKAIETVAKKSCLIKWVNDIFIKDKKVCGILCENVLSKEKNTVEYIIVGIGINVKSAEDFPDELKEIAGAIDDKTDRNELVAEILKGIYNMSSDYDLESYLPYYRQKSLVLGKNINFVRNSVSYNGKVKEINNLGNLEVELEGGEIITLKSGEIRLGYKDICEKQKK